MSAVDEAERIAAGFRRAGFPDAHAVYAYCLDGEMGPDGFWTYTICVYRGRYDPGARVSLLERVARALGWRD